MDGKVSVPRRFFKILVPGFHHKLNLPQAFCKKLGEEKLDHAIIRTSMGTSRVKVCSNEELGLISFEDGWPHFVRRHGLSIGDFVLFEHTGNFHFDAIMFDKSGCEKYHSLSELKKELQDEGITSTTKRKKVEEMSVASFKSKNPFFILTMKTCHAPGNGYLWIPKDFWISNGLVGKTNAILRDPHGREWTVNLKFGKRSKPKCVMVGGWLGFYRGNKLKVGDVCAFELIRNIPKNVVMDVHIFPAPS